MKKPVRILCLEDIEEDFHLITRALHKEKVPCEICRVDTREEFVDRLNNFNPDIILSDHSLPQFNSLEALRICKRMKAELPFILVTGTVSEEFAVHCLKQGADDYVLKTNLVRLPSAIEAALKKKQTENRKKAAEQNLLKRNEELVKINTEMDRFVYSVSHNLRAPLMSVLGLINVAKLQTDHRQIGDYLGLMENSIHKLDETIKEILDYSRNARLDLEYDKINFKTLLEDCLDRLKYLKNFNRIKVNIELSGDSELYSDQVRLFTIFNNLISNAIRYQDERKAEPYIQIHITVKPNEAIISIEDNGIGIHNQYLDKIFTMFFRASEDGAGAGLGLFIVKETIDKLHGNIQVQSKVNDGTRFLITVPNHLPDNQ